jgi:hypothetical protein
MAIRYTESETRADHRSQPVSPAALLSAVLSDNPALQTAVIPSGRNFHDRPGQLRRGQPVDEFHIIEQRLQIEREPRQPVVIEERLAEQH